MRENDNNSPLVRTTENGIQELPGKPLRRNKSAGRPHLNDSERRSHAVLVVYNDSEYERLLGLCKRANMRPAVFLRELSLEGTVREAMSKDMIALLRGLNGIGNNLNQLAREAHISGFASVEKQVRHYMDYIDTLITKYKRR